MAYVQNQRDHVVPLTVGLLAPREARNVDTSLPLEQSLIADGTLSIVDNATPPQAVTPPGSWKETKQSVGDLPAAGNRDGDVRLVRDTLSPFTWDADAEDWVPLAVAANASGSMLTFQQSVPATDPSAAFPLATGGALTRAFVTIAEEGGADVLFTVKVNGATAAILTVPDGETEADVDLDDIDLDAGDRITVQRQGTDGGAALIVLYKAG